MIPLPLATRRTPAASRIAFTLIELLVVVAIITLLIAILLPSLGKARQTSRIAACGSNHRQILTAWTAYAFSNRGALVSSEPTESHGWVANGPGLQPILDGKLYKYLDTPDIYQCPEENRDYAYYAAGQDPVPHPLYERSYSISMYMGQAGVSWSVRSFAAIPNASSALVMLDEAEPRSYNVGSWTIGLGNNWTDWPATWHLIGVNTSFADGHVEFYRHQDPTTSEIAWFFEPAPGSPDLKHFQRIFRPDLQ